ncbi:glycosyltransferase [Francisella frigiditurris]|uniref:Glycosyl transferase 2 family protein n=1 Tax=Francisella frigiditurris TaxID=1542390 RepID=A0A1J0KV47_9GAMM|nr:glycosyltransferase family 2 protein [Francisella frigiditurris]APC97633.1 glycosyl transferase 2 family protein [Francisella frigiditurris]
MKKVTLIFLFILLGFFLSYFDYIYIYTLLVSTLSVFLIYIFSISKKSQSKKNKLTTFVYILFSYSFTNLAILEILKVNYANNGFTSIIIVTLLLPTLFLLSYRIILASHGLYESIFGFNDRYYIPDLDNKPTKGCSIVITTRNEPFEVCKMTFDSAHDLDYPVELKEIIVVDNSDLEFKDLNKWKEYVNKHKEIYGDNKCKFIHRNGVEGFKPRNLDIAIDNVIFNYVLFLDADSTLPKQALNVGMKEFEKVEKLGFVSFLIQSTNYEVNLMTRVTSIFQNTIRYFNEFTGKYGYCNFQGHNGIWSKEALDKTDPWEEYYRGEVMVTEDIAAGFRCYEAGFESKPIFLKTGEWMPTSLKEFERMWLRWSFGGMQVMHKHIKRMLSSSNVTFRVKLDMLYLLFKIAVSGFPFLALLVVAFPRNDLGLAILINLTLLPLIILSIWYYFYGELKGNIFSKIWQIYISNFMLSSFVFWCGIKAEINFYLKKPQGWKPTCKKQVKDDTWSVILRQHVGKILFSSFGLLVAIFSIIRYFDSNDFSIYMFSMIPSILLFLNTILCVLILGKSRS